jgi:hypothetical protein
VFLLLKLIKPLILVIALVAAYFYVPLLGDVSAKPLHRGVSAGVGGTDDRGSCVRRGTKTWRCRVYADGGYQAATYTVRMTDERCWSARLINGQIGGEPLEQRVRRCLHLRDQLPPLPL